MASSIGYPANNSTVYTLVIPRVFGDNGVKMGVTPQDVFQVLNQQNWGVIQGVDCHSKKDFRTGENYRMMFIRWCHFNPPKEILNTLETDGHVEIDINDYGNFWKIRKFQPKQKTQQTQQTQQVTNLREVRVVPNTLTRTDTQEEFNANQDAFLETGLTQQELQFAQTEQDRFDDMLMENRFGLINES